PWVARRRLGIPNHFAAVGLERDDAGKIEIVAAAGAANLSIPRRAVAGSDVQQIKVGIVSHRIPDSAASSNLPPLAVPCLRGTFKRRRLERLRRIAGHGVEPPREFASLTVVRGEVTTYSHLCAAVADQDFAFHHSRSAGDCVRQALIDGDYLPQNLSGCGV